MKATRRPRSPIYYLWDGQRLWRITPKLHREIVSGVALLPQYAGTSQKVIELSWQEGSRGPTPLFLGLAYVFDSDGRFDVTAYAEAITLAIHGGRPKSAGVNITDISPVIQHRRWHEKFTWKPDSKLLAKWTDDLRHGRLAVAPKLAAPP